MIRALVNSSKYRIFLSALAGFVAYGSWGYLVNMSHGWHQGLESGLTQGSYSFTVTLFYSGLIEWLYAKTRKKVLTIVTCSLSVISTSYAVHTLVGTPEILPTIAPGAVIGSVYVYGYVLGLAKIAGKTEKAK